jgi:hypothetical protein
VWWMRSLPHNILHLAGQTGLEMAIAMPKLVGYLTLQILA